MVSNSWEGLQDILVEKEILEDVPGYSTEVEKSKWTP
jgi:hypothetical protein